MKLDIDLTKLKHQIEENPTAVIGVIGMSVAALLNGTAKAMNANSSRKNSKTWRREVVRREKLKR